LVVTFFRFVSLVFFLGKAHTMVWTFSPRTCPFFCRRPAVLNHYVLLLLFQSCSTVILPPSSDFGRPRDSRNIPPYAFLAAPRMASLPFDFLPAPVARSFAFFVSCFSLASLRISGLFFPWLEFGRSWIPGVILRSFIVWPCDPTSRGFLPFVLFLSPRGRGVCPSFFFFSKWAPNSIFSAPLGLVCSASCPAGRVARQASYVFDALDFFWSSPPTWPPPRFRQPFSLCCFPPPRRFSWRHPAGCPSLQAPLFCRLKQLRCPRPRPLSPPCCR